MNNSFKAFVLMPFDSEFNSIYDDLIKPALEDAGYDVSKADSFLDQQNILRDIIKGIAMAQLVIADLTTLNPNVLYELGLCHGLKIPTILLAQSMEEVPFDLRPYRIQIYSTRFDQVHKLKQGLKEIGERHKKNGITFGSPITDFLPEESTMLRSATEIYTEDLSPQAVKKVEDDKGFIDFLLEGTEAIAEMTSLMNAITEETLTIGKKMEEHSAQVQVITSNPKLGSASQFHKIATASAVDMNNFSTKIEGYLPPFENCTNLLVENFSGYTQFITQPTNTGNKKHIEEFRQTISGFKEGASFSLQGVRSFRDTVAGLKGISREINRASRRMTTALDGVIAVIEKVEAFSARMVALMDDMPNQAEG